MTDFDVGTTYVLSQIIVIVFLLVESYRTYSEAQKTLIFGALVGVVVSTVTYVFISLFLN